MKITIYKSRKLQVSEYEPYEFGYGLEDDFNENNVEVAKKEMEEVVDKWIEKETKKWEDYKKFTGVATPIKEREASPF